MTAKGYKTTALAHALQWGRCCDAAEWNLGRITDLTVFGFNGAAAVTQRNAPFGGLQFVRAIRFNGAAAVTQRNGATRKDSPMNDLSLQWGRCCDAAECRKPMGRQRSTRKRFNGAAAVTQRNDG